MTGVICARWRSDWTSDWPLRRVRLEFRRHAIDAVAQAGRRRAVGKHMPQMAAAAAAMHFGAQHAIAAVLGGFDRAVDWSVEAWPAGAALELGLRREQRLVAGGANECARALFIEQRAAARPLGAVLAHDVILLGRQQLAPLRLSVRDGILLRLLHGHLPSMPERLVSRFRSSYRFAARSFTNFGIEGH